MSGKGKKQVREGRSQTSNAEAGTSHDRERKRERGTHSLAGTERGGTRVMTEKEASDQGGLTSCDVEGG
jgi:hypothetical protein